MHQPDSPADVAVRGNRYAALRTLGHVREALVASANLGLSPESLLLSWLDWIIHLVGDPDKRVELAMRLTQALPALLTQASAPAPAPAPSAVESWQDRRFSSPAWQQEPFRTWARAFELTDDWWRHATRNVPGTDPHHEAVVAFVARQWLDFMAPSNQPWSNPEVLQHTLKHHGANLLRGGVHMLQDLQHKLAGLPPVGSEAFVVGRDMACTPGKVVLRNALMELIQYSPATRTVFAEPVLLVPAWIMKYYILDLSPHNSLVRWLVAHGHTVFCISWRNVSAAQRNLGLEDYRRLGVMAAIDTIEGLVPHRKIHALGYCLGGTLLAMAAAAMARAGDARLASLTLLAAQTDFTEPGELQLFIDHAQVHMLDSVMWLRGYLTAEQMSVAFQMLRSNDLIWSRVVHDYMLGERTPMRDLIAWNADSTRMPQRMHSEYLHRLFLNNDLAAGRYLVEGHPVALQNIRAPIFVVGTERDHVAPWRSVYKIHYLADTELTFLLTSGGHNAGIVSEPGHTHRHYRVRAKQATDSCLSADEWLQATPVHEGSWWPVWRRWLTRLSDRRRVAPPPIGHSLMDAPGSYVLVR
ncbi:poly-beta-hydroxybutyrate polymerase [Rhodoferax lacus]|uniref:Poly-beta-hydroxybutyrate polymerase n=1 Tax=Rhodoferax lacus TaxID=2184758 RepID=A0A3E1R9U7_9BURK|nr:alpha/beta fold hydrolase [Rhodoferax lacus]RFO96125.1 poly-beta-hydroxybutyrate polymerase [Rhodoferax lacus]